MKEYLDDITKKHIKKYLENVEVLDVYIENRCILFHECIVVYVKIKDNNKNIFKNKFLKEEMFYPDTSEKFIERVQSILDDYAEIKVSQKVSELKNQKLIEDFKKDYLKKGDLV